MKKLLTIILFPGFIAAAYFTSNTVSAQNIEGDFTAGAGFVFGSGVFDGPGSDEINNDLGIQVNGYYSVTPEIRIGGDFTYYFPSKFIDSGQDWTFSEETTVTELNINGQFIFINKADLMIYGLAGINFTRVKFEIEDRDDFFGDEFYSETISETGLNLGGGIEYNLDFALLYAEAKLANLGGNANQFVLGSGLRFRL